MTDTTTEALCACEDGIDCLACLTCEGCCDCPSDDLFDLHESEW